MAIAFATKAPRMSPYAAASNACASSSVETTSVIIVRMISAVRVSRSRGGRLMSRRSNAQAAAKSAPTATTFSTARRVTQKTPSSGQPTIFSGTPPSTKLVFPMRRIVEPRNSR